MFVAYFIICLYALRPLRVEATPVITIEDVTLTKVSKKYFNCNKTDVAIMENDDGEMTVNTNLTLIETLPEETEGHFKLLGATMGKYNAPTGIEMQLPLCDLLDDPIIFGPFLAVLGFKAGDCPPLAGFYSQEGYTIPVDNFPEDFPENQYLAVFELVLYDEAVIAGDIYLTMQNL